MTATTEYGTWANATGAMTVEETVSNVLAECIDGYDISKVVDDYIAAVNEVLPEGVTLNGNQFYGPYPRDPDLDLAELVAGVDVVEVAEPHYSPYNPKVDALIHSLDGNTPPRLTPAEEDLLGEVYRKRWERWNERWNDGQPRTVEDVHTIRAAEKTAGELLDYTDSTASGGAPLRPETIARIQSAAARLRDTDGAGGTI